MTSVNSLPTKVLGGVTVPDTPLITKALEFAREHSTDSTYNHIVRSFLLGFIIADKILQDRDREAHAIAAILHDLGFPIGHPPHSDVISPDKRFEVDGAHAARRFLQRETDPKDWDKHRLQLVWDAIALHTIGSVVFEKEPEVQACSYGIWADFQGPDRVRDGLLTWDEYNAVVKVCRFLNPKQLRRILGDVACYILLYYHGRVSLLTIYLVGFRCYRNSRA